MMLNATKDSVVVAKVGNGSQVLILNVPVNMTIEKVMVGLPKNISVKITEDTGNCVI